MSVLRRIVSIAICYLALDINVESKNPGLEFRPLPPKENAANTLISFNTFKQNNFQPFVDSLTEFLQAYRIIRLQSVRDSIFQCSYDDPVRPGIVCDVDMRTFYPCVPENYYSYHKSSPCIFLRLNAEPGWRPEYYNDTETLPAEMPALLKNHIKDIQNPKERNAIWVSCEGETAADKENIGPVKVIPNWGIPGYYYPYEKTEGYLHPLVALHLERPQYGVVIFIECKAWAKNIIHKQNEKLGSTRFQLLIN